MKKKMISLIMAAAMTLSMGATVSVSYTHLDVYKRQNQYSNNAFTNLESKLNISQHGMAFQ